MTTLPLEVATAGVGAEEIVTDDHGNMVSSSTSAITGYYFTYSDTQSSFGLWHNNTYQIRGASSVGDTNGFTGTFQVGGGGASDYQSQQSYDNNTAETITDQFDHWETFVYFDTSTSGGIGSGGPVGSATLTIDASTVAPGTHQVEVDWYASASHDFLSFANQYSGIGTQAATFNVVPGQDEYTIDVTKAVNAFLASQTTAAPVLNFRLSTGDSGVAMSGVSATLDVDTDQYPVITPTLSLLPDGSVGVSVDYSVGGALPQGSVALIGLYWSPTSTFNPSTATATSAGVAVQQTHAGPSTFTAAQLGTPPPGTKYLLAVADPGHLVTNPNSQPGVAYLSKNAPSPEELLDLSDAAYNGFSVPSGWTVLMRSQRSTDGFAGAAVEDPSGNVIIVNEGTVLGLTPFDLATLFADFSMRNGKTSAAVIDAVAFAMSVQSTYGGTVYVTGHSLGGIEAEAECKALGANCAGGATFGATGLPGNSDPGPSDLDNFVDYGDPVGNASTDPGSPTASYFHTDMRHYGIVTMVGSPSDAEGLRASATKGSTADYLGVRLVCSSCCQGSGLIM